MPTVGRSIAELCRENLISYVGEKGINWDVESVVTDIDVTLNLSKKRMVNLIAIVRVKNPHLEITINLREKLDGVSGRLELHYMPLLEHICFNISHHCMFLIIYIINTIFKFQK